mgnify:CR=1 FL=1
MKMLNLPVGVEDFKEIKENAYYVDKTLFLEQFIDAIPSTVFLITRPRRFGKSLMLSMVDYFFRFNIDTKYLFEDTNIYKLGYEYIKEINSYPVIHLNFKRIESKTYDELIYNVNLLMVSIIKEYESYLNDIKAFSDKKIIESILNLEINESFLKQSLYKITELLYESTNKKVIVIIDEYDVPIIKSYEKGYYEEAKEFFKMFLGTALKGNNYLYKGLISGVNQIANTSIFSDLNNLRVISIISQTQNEYFGFTELEINKLLNYYGYKNNLDEIKKWYGGYIFQGKEIYNPWSILSFIANGFQFDKYWVTTGSYSLLKKSIMKINESSYNELSSLLYGNCLDATLKSAISLENNADKIELYSMLVSAGYLTARRISTTDFYFIYMPNEEIKSAFVNEILSLYSENNALTLLANLKIAFIEGDSDKIANVLSLYVLNCFSYYDLSDERIYQIIVTTVLSILFTDSIVLSEVNSGLGRCDIYISSKNNDKFALIIEIKHLKGRRSIKDIESSSISALNQIKNKGYIENALKEDKKEIILYGMSFSNKNIVVKKEKYR